MKNEKRSTAAMRDPEFRRLIDNRNVKKVTMVKNGKVFRYGYDK